MCWLVFLGLLGSALAGNTSPSQNCGKLDLVFLLDSSGSVTSSGWDLTLQTVYDMVSLFTIGSDDVDVGIVSFSGQYAPTNVRVDQTLGFPKTKPDLLNLLTTVTMPWLNGNTHMDEGLPAAAALFDDGRDDAPDVLVIITDGVPCCNSNQADLTTVARNALDASITTFAIGVGNLDQTYIDFLSGDPARSFMPSDFDDLVALSLDLANTVCDLNEPVICDPWKWHDASSYKFCRTRMNYEKAKAVCEGMDSHLVEINNAAEHVFVAELVYHSKMRCAWLGGIRHNFQSLDYYWETTNEQFYPCGDTSPCPFESFAPGEPNGNNWAKCVELNLNGNYNGRWNDENCKRWRTFVCERGCCIADIPASP